MVFKGCQRCNGDLWAEEDIISRLQDLVCLQCGHRQTKEHTNAPLWLMSQRRSRIAV
jgi:DNA-directed RNA polymerase subunit RPC12/RpoP